MDSNVFPQATPECPALAAVRDIVCRLAVVLYARTASYATVETVQVVVDNQNGSWHVAVPVGVTEAACAVVKARSRAWEAVLYAATNLDEEALISVAAAYAVMQCSSLTTLPEALPAHLADFLAPYFLAGMVDESAQAERVGTLTVHASLDSRLAHLQARYADALVRTASAAQLESVLLEEADSGVVDKAFIRACKAHF